jgi:hypothetical protein
MRAKISFGHGGVDNDTGAQYFKKCGIGIDQHGNAGLNPGRTYAFVMFDTHRPDAFNGDLPVDNSLGKGDGPSHDQGLREFKHNYLEAATVKPVNCAACYIAAAAYYYDGINRVHTFTSLEFLES